jgi:hypothetical protein
MASIGHLAKQLEFFTKTVAVRRFNLHAQGATQGRGTRQAGKCERGGKGTVPQAAALIVHGHRGRYQSREST